jgi:hypothetical protein
MLEKLIEGLGAKRQGGSWKAKCPCHDDTNDSLDITQKSGKVLVKCFGGCAQENVIESLRGRGLWPEPESNGSLPAGIYRKLGKSAYVDHWTYKGVEGRVIGYVVRYQNESGDKEFRPYFRQEAGTWKQGAAPKPRALYGLWGLEKQPDAPVVICEGEKATDAAQRFFPGHVCVSSPGGAQSASSADWKPLAGRSVLVWPDSDAPGLKYAADVIECLQAVGADIKGVIDVAALGMPPKGDAADWHAGKPLPEPLPSWSVDELLSKLSKLSKGGNHSADSAALSKHSAKTQQALSNSGDEETRFLTGEIRKWIMESRGSFTTTDVDREFCLTTRAQKNLRSRVLSDLLYRDKERSKDLDLSRGIISKDKHVRGRYHILEANPEWLNIEAHSTDSFPLALPLGLSDLVNLPAKSIVVLAGSTNSGKTALALDIAAKNLDRHKGNLLYLYSEMGSCELVKRLKTRNDVPFESWKSAKFLERTTDFGGVITAHNPNGISIIDFLEEPDGEYYKLASQIRRVYDCLESGIAIVCLQKNSAQTYGKGGEGTAEKARLYLVLDRLLEFDSGLIASIRILKAKDYVSRNPNGLEIHCKVNGHGLFPLMKQWERMDSRRRDSLVAQYQLAFGK